MKISLLGLKVAPVQNEDNKKPKGSKKRKFGRKCVIYWMAIYPAFEQLGYVTL